MELGSGTLFWPEGWRWKPFSIFLIRSERAGWRGLRDILEEGPIYHLAGEARNAETAVQRVCEMRPEAILLPDDLKDAPAVDLAVCLREACPGSKLVVVGEEPDHDLLVGLGQARVDAYLSWTHTTELGVFCCLMAVLQAGLKVGTERAAQELVAAPERRRRDYIEGLHLTGLEVAVLEGLATGLTYEEIAGQASTSIATVGRVAEALKGKLGVETRHALAALAIALGFGREKMVERFTQSGEKRTSQR
jgi:DNA-binding NarL/FixJ family response regulator